MTADPSPEARLIDPPPEARLIRELREQPPLIAVRAAAEAIGLSEARWRQIEGGFRTFRGVRYPETGPPQTIARMALIVGATPQMLEDAGAPAAAAELASLITEAAVILSGVPARTRHLIARKMRHDIRN